MALRLKKDIKKASYYVWFLGAQESRGLRGEEYALPAIEHLDRRSRDLEPFKVTLQVSHKGLKIIQNVAPKGKQQTIKHFIPHGSITSVVVQGDVVACVLLLFNPVTGCPIHVHAYRCDSDRTAELLCAHLQALIDKPENQKKFADIERKLQIKGALPPKKLPDSSLGSEVSTRESESGSSEERCVATLYDSLAAELKQKLSTGKSPILLPPRDYDTVHRQRGNLSGIDTRRCLNQSIVGVNARRKMESSGASSGIGSDLAPSPDQEYPRQHDNQSTSEEDWAESTAYLMHEAYDVSPPRRAISPRRDPAFEPPSPFRDHSTSLRDVSQTYRDQTATYRDQAAPYREHTVPYRDQTGPYREKPVNYRDRGSHDRRYRPESLERIEKYDKVEKYVEKSKVDKYADKVEKYVDQVDKIDKFDKYPDDGHHYRRRFVPEPLKQMNRSVDRLDERQRPDERRIERDERKHFAPKLQRGISEGSLKTADASPKDRFNVAKEKFMNLERERFNRELEKHMLIRRNMIERNGRATSSPEDDVIPRREDMERTRHEDRYRRDDLERPKREEHERSTRDAIERARREDLERPRREEPVRARNEEFERPRHSDLPIERQLPRVGRKVPREAEPRRFEFGSEDFFDRQPKPRRRDDDIDRRERRELETRIEEDDVIEPVMEDRRRDWTDRQRNFSRSRIIEEHRHSYGEPPYAPRDHHDLTERERAKFRHSYAEPIPRGRVAALRPY